MQLYGLQVCFDLSDTVAFHADYTWPGTGVVAGPRRPVRAAESTVRPRRRKSSPSDTTRPHVTRLPTGGVRHREGRAGQIPGPKLGRVRGLAARAKSPVPCDAAEKWRRGGETYPQPARSIRK